MPFVPVYNSVYIKELIASILPSRPKFVLTDKMTDSLPQNLSGLSSPGPSPPGYPRLSLTRVAVKVFVFHRRETAKLYMDL